MKSTKRLILILILAAAVAVLLNPQWISFLDTQMQQSISEQVNVTFGDLFHSTGALSLAKLVCSAAILLGAWLMNLVICALLEILEKKGKHRQSVAGLFTSLSKFLCFLIGGVWALNVLGVNLTGIFASLGLASLIIGFGAQSLIEDAITGIFIIFEGQYNVGDIIVLDEFRGFVRNIGVRTTTIEDAGGNMKIVNNSDIRNVQNRSRNRSVAVCDVGISYDARIEEVEAILVPALEDIYQRNRDVFLAKPIYVGVEELGESCVVLRLNVDVTEENFFIGRRRLNRELKILFDNNSIEIPFNQLVIHQAES